MSLHQKTSGAIPAPALPGSITPTCRMAAMSPAWAESHKQCRAPGYEHEVIGRVDIPCACSCHVGPAVVLDKAR
jgi:hypothetical protein